MKRSGSGRERFAVLILTLLIAMVLANVAVAQQTPSAARPAEKTIQGISAPAGGTAVQGTGALAAVMEVKYENNLLSVKAEKTDLPSLLRKVAESAGVAIEISPDVAGEVSASFADVSVEDGVKRILEAYGRTNFAAEFKVAGVAADKSVMLEKIIIASGKRGQMPGQGVASRTDFAALYDHIRRRYGKYEAYLDDGTGRLRDIKFHEPGVSRKISRDNMEQYCRAKFEEFFPLLGISMDMFIFEGVREDAIDTVCVFPQVVNGVPVEGAAVSVGVWKPAPGKNANDLVGFGNRVHPDVAISTEPKLTPEEAVKVAGEAQRSDFGAKKYERLAVSEIATKPPELLVYPKPEPADRPKSYSYHLVWKVRFYRTTYYIDAGTGEVVQSGGNIAYDTLEGTVKAKRWGNGPVSSAGNYVDDLSQQTNGLVGLTVRDGGLAAAAVTDAEGHYRFEGAAPVSVWLESTARLEPPSGFAIHTGFSEFGPWPRLAWSSADGVSGEFPDGADTGHQGNVYHQMERGLVWLLNSDDFANNEPPMLNVHAAVPAAGMSRSENLGETDGSSYIKLTSEGGTTSDVILHELMHTAAFKVRGNWISAPYVYEQAAVDEGLATYFAIRANDDSNYDTYATGGSFIQVALDPQGYEPSPVDWNGDGVISHLDWQHYKNGDVLASTLWDLHVGGMDDGTVWKAIQPHTVAGAVPEGAYKPEQLYEALKYFEADPDLLWTVFSAHGVNLDAEPYRVIGGALAGASVN